MTNWLAEPFRRPVIGVLFLILTLVVVLGAGIQRSLLTPYDDAFFAYAAKRLASDSQWLELKTRTGLLLEKPPLVIWFQALSFHVFGAHTWAVRLPGLLVTVCGVVLGYGLVRRHWGHMYALLGCLILVTSQQVVHFARRPVTEIYLTIWVMLALLFYWDALVRSRGFWATGLFTALAVMTKGTVGMMPYGIILTHLLVTRSWAVLRSHRLWLAVLETILLVIPWHALMIARHSQTFLDHYFWNTQLSFITGTRHVEPWHWSTIMKKIVENYWPWLLILAPALAGSSIWLWRTRDGASVDPQSRAAERATFSSDWAERRWLVFLLTWFAVIFVFFHLTYVKRHQYVLPAYPAMAFLAAWAILRLRAAWRSRLLAAVTTFVAVAVLAAAVTPFWPQIMDNNNYGKKLGAVRYLEENPHLAGTLLIFDDDPGYCFSCDTVGFYTDLLAYDYDAELLKNLLEGPTPVLVWVLTSLRAQLASEIPPGWTATTLYADDAAGLLALDEVK